MAENITVSLVIELGKIPMSLDEVGTLAAGKVLSLPQTSKDPVNLIIGDKTVGQAELVEVEGKLGVKILSINGK